MAKRAPSRVTMPPSTPTKEQPRKKLHRPPRPRIQLPMPGQFVAAYPQTPMAFVNTPYGQASVPLTPNATQPATTIVYTNKASDFLNHLKGFKNWTKSGLSLGEKSAFWLYEKVGSWSKRWFTHLFLFFVLFLYSILGAFLFIYIEGEHESNILEDIKKERDEMIQQIRDLWNDQELARDSEKWKGCAKNHLMLYEEKLYTFLKKLNFQSRPDNVNWAFWNAVIYCSTIYTTIGYGHISPSTTTGRALTIVYAIIGIPMFLIVLADFGKLFTRGIKFLWAFVRRVYYTGSCRKVRRTVQVQEMMKGVQLVYDLAKFRRPSEMTPEEFEEMERLQQQQQQQQQTVLNLDGNVQQQQQPESPSTPAMSTFEIDDEFNLPISVAITILVMYIFIGATVFNFFEEWSFFESFYFVFISMSTIGFGDFVPQDPLYMMLSIVYMIFGLALTSMCINVVQLMLTDQFKQASEKIGASIGLHVSEEDGSLKPAPPPPVELAEVHKTSPIQTEEKIAPKAKQEEADL